MWRLAASLEVLRAEVDVVRPDRDRRSDGTIGDRAHAGRISDHNPNGAGVVQAWDCTDDGGTLGRSLAEHLRTCRDARTKYVISEAEMFSSYPTKTHAAWEWRPYSGVNLHSTHTHISVVDDPDLYDDPTPWGFFQTEDDMPLTDDDVARIAGAVWDRRLLDGSSAGRRLAAVDQRTAKLLTVASVEKTAAEVGCDPEDLLDALHRRLAE